MPGPYQAESDEFREQIAQWAECWELPGLEGRVAVSFSRRFRSSLGRCWPASGRIRLAAFLRDGPPDLLTETLCHEAAHAAVYERFGARARPHGAEWRELMRAAGFEPRARVPAALLEGVAPARKRSRGLWLHRCPVCQASRLARRAVGVWRCAACRRDGLEGRLVIAKLSGGSSVRGGGRRLGAALRRGLRALQLR